jgi:nucleotide-binding universal stress UspA family protein
MYTRILVATGGSPWSDAAVAYAIALAIRTRASLRIVTVLTVPAAYALPDMMGGSDLVIDGIEREGQVLQHKPLHVLRVLGCRVTRSARGGTFRRAFSAPQQTNSVT